ncbi:MAG: hypothetical protein IPM31_10505 [Anaerolineae bacterium]|nr:hypothetical protein [Anaerolineae bacterium]MBL8104128.1 hypothetical protein [Anaerolineales bacterium]MCC7190984.1 hypothetical protein [Anaerolineales bacterium]
MKILIGAIFTFMMVVGVFLFYIGSKGYRFPTTIRERWARSLKLGFAIPLLMYGGFYFYDLLTRSKSIIENQIEMILVMVPVGGIISTIGLFLSLTSHELRRKLEKSTKSKKDNPDNFL